MGDGAQMQRRTDDGRIAEIQQSVHGINERLMEHDKRLGEVEKGMFANSMKLDSLDVLWKERLDIIHSNTQRTSDSLSTHIAQEDADRRELIRDQKAQKRWTISVFVTVMLALFTAAASYFASSSGG